MKYLSGLLRGVLLLGLGAVLLPMAQAANGCAQQTAVMPAQPEQAPGLGGTGIMAARPGLGGTGVDSAGGVGAIGGTGGDAGGVGGTGIVGVITGFASVCVNGVEVDFDASTAVDEGGLSVSLNTLAVGKLVAIRATRTMQGLADTYSARSISVLNAITGPVTAVQPGRGQLQLLGQTVLLGAGLNLDGIHPGQWVQLSGYRLPTGQIQASFLAAIAPQALAHMTGVLERNRGLDLVVSGTEVHLENTRLPDAAQRGSELAIAGVWDGRTLRAHQLVAEPAQRSLVGVQAVVVEGFVHAVGVDSISLGLHSLQLERNVQVQGGALRDLQVGQKVRLSGRVDAQQKVHVQHIELRPDAGRSGAGARAAPANASATQAASDDQGSAQDASGSDDSAKTGDTSGRPLGSASSGSGSSGSRSGSSSGSAGSGAGTGSSGGSGSSGGGGSSGGSGGTSGGGGGSGGSGGSGSASGKGK